MLLGGLSKLMHTVSVPARIVNAFTPIIVRFLHIPSAETWVFVPYTWVSCTIASWTPVCMQAAPAGVGSSSASDHNHAAAAPADVDGATASSSNSTHAAAASSSASAAAASEQRWRAAMSKTPAKKGDVWGRSPHLGVDWKCVSDASAVTEVHLRRLDGDDDLHRRVVAVLTVDATPQEVMHAPSSHSQSFSTTLWCTTLWPNYLFGSLRLKHVAHSGTRLRALSCCLVTSPRLCEPCCGQQAAHALVDSRPTWIIALKPSLAVDCHDSPLGGA